MIILDTSALTKQGPNSPLWEVFAALRSGGVQLAIPEVVLYELLAQRERDYRSALDAARSAYDTLWALQFTDEDGVAYWPAVPNVEQHVDEWEQRYRGSLTVLPLTLDAAREGLRREAYRLRPARSSGKTAIGSRDAAIWMTVVEQARRGGEPVHFVSLNSNDFGPDGNLFPDLRKEADEADAEIAYFNDLNKVLEKFSSTDSVDAGDTDLDAKVTAPATAAWLHQYVVSQVASGQFSAAAVNFDDHEGVFLNWEDYFELLSSPEVQVLRWTNGARYGLADGTHTWAATVRLLVVAYARELRYPQDSALTAFAVDVRLLFGADALTALSAGSTQDVADDDYTVAYEAAWRYADRFRGEMPAPAHPSNLRRVMQRPPGSRLPDGS